MNELKDDITNFNNPKCIFKFIPSKKDQETFIMFPSEVIKKT